ncbi:transforming growth factor-beta receptor-associated protein 1-like [Actinia tenebrosa]|uniref:Transforming growth factor-beta receptor-associated protein 1-like n=1 Tax=Actinia tenebrosa TaxID=6105 RepID=A0A6P8IG32_ACTTE|nr:transforming growth factor-beta receptor-associated protein 1-like [Actinia tenebrosa]
MSFKAFDLIPVLEKIATSSSDKPKTIECLDCAAQNLFIGTADCYVFHYVFDDTVSPLGRTTFQCSLLTHKHIGMKKPIQQVVTAPTINRLLVLCDGIILMFSMFELEIIVSGFKDKLKGVNFIAKNENPNNFDPFAVEICISIARKKSIQIVSVTENKIIPLKEITLAEPPFFMAADAGAICVALSNQYRYCMVNALNAKVQELFHYEAERTKGLIMRIRTEEFLLNGPTDLMGMFVTSEGTSQRAPLTWSFSVEALGYSFPYVVALGTNIIAIYSIVSQDNKAQRQTVTFKGGKLLLNYENKVFVCSNKELYCLVQLPYKKQIEMLLAEKKVNEALHLAHIAMETETGSERDSNLLSQVQQQAGFIYFSEGCFRDAGELMIDGGLDPRELIVLFPSLLISSWTFLPSRDLHNIKDVNGLMKGSKTFMAEAKNFLLSFLEDSRRRQIYVECKVEVDTALLKLYAEINSPKLLELVTTENYCAVEDTEPCLMKYKRYHATALFHIYHNEPQKALDFWKRLCFGELVDETFPGLPCVASFLSSVQDYDLLWNHVPWLLEKNQEIAIKVFTERPSNEPHHDSMTHTRIVEYLQQKFPVAQITYLEFLIFTKKIDKEKFHTHLALLYLEQVFSARRDPSSSVETIQKAREKLRNLLEMSKLYRVSHILSKITEDSDLDAEAAILYGKMEQHDKALKILVYKLNDFKGAVRYCNINSKDRDQNYRAKLFHALLLVYLKPDKDIEPFVQPAISLLNSHMQDFDTVEVLRLIPEEWSIGVLSRFLTGSVRSSLHKSRNIRIQSELEKQNHLKVKVASVVSQKGTFSINEERLCQACRRPFNDPAVARYPNGVLTHVHCARNKNVCPLTGRVFSATEQ